MSNASVPDLRRAELQTAAQSLFPDGAPFLDLGLEPDDYRAAAQLLSAMAEYCDLCALAIVARTEGRVSDALKLESRAEHIYGRLPAGARW